MASAENVSYYQLGWGRAAVPFRLGRRMPIGGPALIIASAHAERLSESHLGPVERDQHR